MRTQVKSILQRYEEVNAVNGKKFTPRKGYYLIKSIYLSPMWNIHIAKCCWKEKEEDTFNLYVEVEIQFMSFYEASSKPESFDPEALRGKVVFVADTYNDYQVWRGKEEPIVRCVWSTMNRDEFILPLIKFADLPDSLHLCEIYDDPDGHLNAYLDYENDLIDEAFIAEDQDLFTNGEAEPDQGNYDAYDAEDGVLDSDNEIDPENDSGGEDNDDLQQ